jgi:hypothetical protein
LPGPNPPPAKAFTEPGPYSKKFAPQSTEGPSTLAARGLDKPQQEEVVPPLNSVSPIAPPTPVAYAPVPQVAEVHPPGARVRTPAAWQNNSANRTPQNRNSSSPLGSAPSSQSPPRPIDNWRAESNDQFIASSNPSANANPLLHGNPSVSRATSNPASNNSSNDWSAKAHGVSAAPPPLQHQAAATALRSANDAKASGIPNPSMPVAAYNPTTTMVPLKSRTPLIQMDVAERRVAVIRAGDSDSFVNLPGERILETSSATMRIQRSVRAPKTTSGWLFHREKDKKVIIGDLTSRIDPQVSSSQLAPGDFVRVRATIAEDGSVLSVKPIHGAQNLVPVVLNAVHAWRFQPTFIDGKAVETESDVLIQFHPPNTRSRQ